MSQDPKQHSVRRIVLPSGRSIEVVRFDGVEEPTTEGGLHICPDCRSDLVQPIEWSEAPGERWELLLGCPNCHWFDEGIYSQQAVYALEEHLDEGLADMLHDLQRLTHANMTEQVDRFIAALHADHILPEDF
jgi:hypothetical protein